MDETALFLEHYGVKGMRWGVRKRAGKKLSSINKARKQWIKESKEDRGLGSFIAHPRIRKAVKEKFSSLSNQTKADIIVAGAAVVGLAITAYANRKMTDSFNRQILESSGLKMDPKLLR